MPSAPGCATRVSASFVAVNLYGKTYRGAQVRQKAGKWVAVAAKWQVLVQWVGGVWGGGVEWSDEN